MKIQSVSDIITNSSSEVFIMSVDDALHIEKTYGWSGCIDIDVLTWDYFMHNPYEWDTFAEILDIPQPDKRYYDIDEEEKEEFFASIKDKFIKKFGEGEYAMVDIEDHFSGCEDAYDDARAVAIWSDWRH